MLTWFDSSALTAAAAVTAVVIATVAWFTSDRTYRTSFRPIVRPVPIRDDSSTIRLSDRSLLLKNYGRGPAFGVLLFDPDDGLIGDPIASVNVVEPLGADPIERNRIGRATVELRNPHQLRLGHRDRVICQDLAGVFHETTLTVEGGRFRVKFLGGHDGGGACTKRFHRRRMNRRKSYRSKIFSDGAMMRV